MKRLSVKIKYKPREIDAHEYMFFTHLDNVEVINKAMLYIKHNEPTKRVMIVTVEEESIKDVALARDIEMGFIQKPGAFSF